MKEIDGSWQVEFSGEIRFSNAAQLTEYIEKTGILPYFKCGIDGFSTEEFCDPRWWWSDDPERDPWQWRAQLAEQGAVAYGKIFHSKAGFVSRELYPVFASYRRDGYDFDSLCDEGLVNSRQKSIMSFFEEGDTLAAWQFKRQAGFSKDGAKGFEGTLSKLQMMTYLTVRGFSCRRNKQGREYGWPVTQYSTPEALWGDEHVRSGYIYTREQAFEILAERIVKACPNAGEKEIRSLLSL